MAGKIIADTLEHSTAGSIATNYVVNGSAKAWAEHSSGSPSAIKNSFGISSLTDSGVGYSTLNLQNAMSSIDYSATGTSGTSACAFTTSPSTSYYEYYSYNRTSLANAIDLGNNNSVVHGDLA